MPLLEKIKQMQAQNMSDEQITRILQEQGHSPNEIYESLSQSKIKSAIFDDKGEQEMTQETPTATEYKPQLPPQYQTKGRRAAPVYQETYEAQPTAPPAAAQEQAPEGYEAYGQDYATGYEGYPPENYGGYAGYEAGVDADMVNEIAEQVVAEKLNDVIKTITNLVEFKTKTEAKIENINTRLERTETALDQLQSAVIRKVGNYVQDVQDIKTEMRLMQGSFSKALPAMAKKAARAAPRRKTIRKKKK